MKTKPEPFHPDLRAARWVPLVSATRSTLWLFRGSPKGKASTPDVSVETVQLPAGEGERSVRVFRPRNASNALPALFWIHGGGLVIGSPQQDDATNLALAKRLGIVVVAASYRLAPEHPAPAALDDLVAEYRAVLERADEFGIDPERVAIGGGSAGGGLAAALVQRLHDEGGTQPVFQLLIYPMLDDRTVLRTDVDTRHLRFWSPASNRFGWESYLGVPAGSETVPPYSVPARREDLSGLPPAWIGVGTIDLFHAEDLDYAQRLRASGVPCEVVEVPGAFHGFDATFTRAGVTEWFHSAAAEALRVALGV